MHKHADKASAIPVSRKKNRFKFGQNQFMTFMKNRFIKNEYEYLNPLGGTQKSPSESSENIFLSLF